MKRKLLATLLTASLAVGTLAGCGQEVTSSETESATSGATETSSETSTEAEELPLINLDSAMPVVNEPVSVTIAVTTPGGAVDFKPENNWMCQYFDKYSGLDITWEHIPIATANESIPIMLNSGSMPDAILGYNFDPLKLVEYGQVNELFMPINDLLQYMPAFTQYLDENPDILPMLYATDGNIYGFPAINNVNNYGQRFEINKEWLKNVGMEMPKTLDDLKDVLIAFRDKDANGNGDLKDEIPWAGSWTGEARERVTILGAYGLITNSSMNNTVLALDYSSGEPVMTYLPEHEDYKAALTYLNDLWNEGLMDSGMFTQDSAQAKTVVLDGKAGFTEMSSVLVYAPDNPEDWEVIDVLVAEEGDTPVFPGPAKVVEFAYGKMVINADCEPDKAAALANLADFFFTVEGYALNGMGPEKGTELDWYDTGYIYNPETTMLEYPDMPENANGSAWTHRITNQTLYSAPGFTQAANDPKLLEYAKKYPNSPYGQRFANGLIYDQDQTTQIAKNSPYYVNQIPKMFFSADDNARLVEIETVLEPYVAGMEAKFITGELSIEKDWDEYVKTIKEYGGYEFFEIYDSYYKTYQANK